MLGNKKIEQPPVPDLVKMPVSEIVHNWKALEPAIGSLNTQQLVGLVGLIVKLREIGLKEEPGLIRDSAFLYARNLEEKMNRGLSK